MMTTARMLLASIGVIAGCMTGDVESPEHEPPLMDVASTGVEAELSAEVEPSVCELLPDDGSACSAACDPEQLSEFVPAGTCAVFACTLTNGDTIGVHACAPQ